MSTRDVIVRQRKKYAKPNDDGTKISNKTQLRKSESGNRGPGIGVREPEGVFLNVSKERYGERCFFDTGVKKELNNSLYL